MGGAMETGFEGGSTSRGGRVFLEHGSWGTAKGFGSHSSGKKTSCSVKGRVGG